MNIKDRLRAGANFILDRMKEPSTWQGVGFVVTLCGAKWGVGVDWGQAAAMGGIVSAFLKATIPDVLGEKNAAP